MSKPAYERVGRLADGWFPQLQPGPQLQEARAIVDASAAAAGRDPASLGIEGRVGWSDGAGDQLAERAVQWRNAGATHLSINTMGAGLDGVDGHLAALAEAADSLEVAR
jgi:alkanesulfonate monooxygenase SsuD/methylene tetrahydromethanopterin reductase-like flavin-dependent oxidoreductase (luciferase family)